MRSCISALFHRLAVPVSIGVLFLIAIAVIAPWGDFPINDDWQYAFVAKQFAEHHTLDVVVPVAPTLIGQTLLVYPLIKIMGFSHLFLRVFTIALSMVILFLVNSILRKSGVLKIVRWLTLSTIAFNVLHLVLSLSFMTEIYGYFWAILAVWIWLGSTSAWARWLAIAICSIIAFWTRQFAFLWFLAIILTDLLTERSIDPPRYFLKSGLISIWSQRARLFGIILSTTGVLAYFVWSQSTHIIKNEFVAPLKQILAPSLITFTSEAAMTVYYMTLFCLPLLIPFAAETFRIFRDNRHKWRIIILLGFVGMLVSTAIVASNDLAHGQFQLWTRPFFPFKGNLLNHYGVGPMTTTDAFFSTDPHGLARISDGFWYFLAFALTILMFLWIPPLRHLRNMCKIENKPWDSGEKLVAFSWIAALLNFVVVVTAFRHNIIDRYYYGSFLALVLGLSVHCSRTIAANNPEKNTAKINGRISLFAAGTIGVALAAVVTCLTYDFWRWHETRYEAYQSLIEQGITPAQIDGGFELNGWAAYSLNPKKADTDPCYFSNWFCHMRPLAIGIFKPRIDHVHRSYKVPALLAPNRWIFQIDRK